ncbi:hypothetical protein GPECTOR_1g218 [Gonium pectorale]|uniref:Glycoside hydrolase family 1 protein n=1 Tax=Gonium pectorale TaxID=33097 RepID=A0A150H3V6_GONPE|nr:hypothetical protein GPECTOR_1g218 [Gonium pectorale]|eukprot:KXZ56250.1 hypothetical protein GPECTOR_1g218 [Gonium pectorale]
MANRFAVEGGAKGSKFLKGCAISVWQNSPDEQSQWSAFAKKPHNVLERIRGKSPQLKIDKSPDFWNRYLDDIACAKRLGSNSLRLSIEWARIMPTAPESIDQAAVQRYLDILAACREAGLQPMVTLHHFVHPDWFQRLGGFEREENIGYFVSWALTAFRLFRPHGVRLWATFNEPTCAAFTGYIVGIHAPGRCGATRLAGVVLLNMLRAHAAAHAAIRAQPGGDAAEVGLVHQQIRFEAAGSGLVHGAARWAAQWLTHCFGYDLVHEYLMTGRFAWRQPGRRGFAIDVLEPNGRPPCDWLGINYYTRVVLDWRMGFTCRHGEVLTDMGWPIVPEGLYAAIAHCAELGLPLYVTETGIADGRDDRRAALIAAYWGQMSRAVADGFDVRGFYYWTLCDNYEWHLGYNMKFGLFEWTGAPKNPRANPAAAKAARRAARNAPTSAPHGAATGDDSVEFAVVSGHPLPPLHIAPTGAGTATATIIGVSPPGTPWRRPKLPGADVAVCDVSAASASAAAAAAAVAEAERAVAEAAAGEECCPGRRLRHGALELIRRYVATPEDLTAAREMLCEIVWPHVPLPAALAHGSGGKRGPVAAVAGVAGAAAGAAGCVLRSLLGWGRGAGRPPRRGGDGDAEDDDERSGLLVA